MPHANRRESRWNSAFALLVAALAAVALLTTSCSDGESSDGDSASPSPAATAPTGSATSAAGALTDLEQDVTTRVNDRRVENGLDRLATRSDLVEVARQYSCKMAEESFFSHESPEGRFVDDRVNDAGITYRQVGENLAYHTGDDPMPETIVEGWMDSEGHRENILREGFEQTGVGACQGGDRWYYTQVFLTPR